MDLYSTLSWSHV